VDAAYVAMYVSQRLFATAGLYAAFLVLAVLGFREWRRSMVTGKAA
jgi:nicotinamide mononucleotide transporter